MPKKLFPVGLGYVATAMKRFGWKFDLLDLDADRNISLTFDKIYDVVCLGSLVTGYKKVKEILKIVRIHNPYAKIIVGNSVATSIPKILLENTEADIAVMLEGDETIIDLLNVIEEGRPLDEVLGIYFKKKGRIVKTLRRPLIKDISNLSFVDFNIFAIEKYITGSFKNRRALPMSTARGCPNNCTFCYHTFRGEKYRYRKPESIISDVERLIEEYSLDYIQFWDEVTFFSKKQANNLVQAILDSGLKFGWLARCRANLFNKEEDLEILKKMKQANCENVQFSLESSDPEILRAMGKNITAEQFSFQTQLFKKAGLNVLTSLVFGYPQETPKTIQNTINCCIENGVYPSAGFLLPQPNSPMYEYAKTKGFIANEEDYILKMGDRQDLLINLTSMEDERFKKIVNNELERCNIKLGRNLRSENLIKNDS
jgi:radical SAM superfamily enzyme YgiQ (UPF0313 family)